MTLRQTLLFAALLWVVSADAQRGRKADVIAPTPAADRLAVADAHAALDAASWTAGLDLRCVGPTVMSGRVVDLSVNPADPAEFVVAYATGGLWHTTDHGTSFTPLFDHETVIFLGAIAVDWDTRTIWAGTGEVNSSRSSYAGLGVYRSTDWGANWEHMGLADSHHIGRMALTADGTVYVAALGALYQDDAPGERGLYRWTEATGQWTLLLDGTQAGRPAAGAVDLVVDAANEDHLYVALWDRTRRAWDFTEGGPGSGVFESIDGGATWVRLTSEANGFPAENGIGRIGLAYHPGAARLYVMVDNQNAKPDDKKEDAEDESENELEAKDFRGMNAKAFAALDTAALTTFLEDNGFPENADAASLFQRVADGDLDPEALADYLGDANAEMFNPPIIGAEVYRWAAQPLRAGESAPRGIDAADAVWVRTHEEGLDEVCYSYCYYFGLIEVDPTDETHVVIGGVPLLESTDGGAMWSSIAQDNVHVDHHHIWFDPADPLHLINGNDGGINVTFDGGEHWTSCNSPAVGQFYAVAVDDAKPYRIYGGLQDNGTWRGPSGYEASPRWHQTGDYPYDRLNGGDGMQIQVDTRDNETVYTGSQFGWYARSNKQTGDRAFLHPKHTLGETPLRWNWQTPIYLSRHHQDVLYMASNRVHRSLAQGDDFEVMSGDLTRGSRQGNVPFGSLTSLNESPLRFGRLAVGSDDGLLHTSMDGGYTWEDRTPPAPNASPDRSLWISEVLWSHHEADQLYATFNGYRHDHFAPYLYVSDDAGANWTRIGDDGTARDGLPMEPINALAESADVDGLLFCGTDGGLYVSMDGGLSWSLAHPDLPRVPVHDLVIQEREDDLVIGTHGRSIWVLDIAPLVAGLSEEDLDLTTLRFDAPEELEWREGWGKRGYGWDDAWEPEVSVSTFLPESGTCSIQAEDSTGVIVMQTEFESTRRGWQTLEFVPKKLHEDGFLDPGTYTVILKLADGTTARQDWAILEEE